MISVVVHEGDTIRIRIPELTHDVEGRVTEGDVSYTLFIDDTDEVIEQGVLGYTPQMGWSTITTLPDIASSKRMRVEVVATALGAQRTFSEVISVRAL